MKYTWRQRFDAEAIAFATAVRGSKSDRDSYQHFRSSTILRSLDLSIDNELAADVVLSVLQSLRSMAAISGRRLEDIRAEDVLALFALIDESSQGEPPR